MKRMSVLFVAAVAVFVFAALGWAIRKDMKMGAKAAAMSEKAAVVKDQAVKTACDLQKHCPTCGGDINKAHFMEHEGKKIYACNTKCLKKIKKDPQAALKKIKEYRKEAKGEVDQSALKPQVTCPVMGGKVNKKMYVDHEGKRIYVCCAGCVKKVKADPDKWIQKLKKMGEMPEPMK